MSDVPRRLAWLGGLFLLLAGPAVRATPATQCPPGASVEDKRDGAGQLLAQGCRKGPVNHGPMTFYDPAGWKQMEATYKEGQLDGKVTAYWASGKKRLTGSYVRGKPDGRFTAWNEAGKELGSYVMRAGTGTRIEWYPSGKKQQEVQLKNDAPDGWAIDFYENGQIENKVPYKSGKKEGKALAFHPNGKKSGEVEYHNDLKDGIELHWNARGIKVSEQLNKDGEPLGKQWHWDDQGLFQRVTCSIRGKELWTLPPVGSTPTLEERKAYVAVVAKHPCP